MAREDANLAGVSRDLMSIESRALAGVRGYGRCLQDAEKAGLPEVAYFVRQLMEEDAARAAHARGLLARLSVPGETGMSGLSDAVTQVGHSTRDGFPLWD